MTEEIVVTVPTQEPLNKDTQTEATISSTVSSAPKKLQVVPNWRKVLFTWSLWLHIASVILTLVDQILPYVGILEPTMTTATYAIVMFSLNALGVLARFVKQKKLWTFDPSTGEVTAGEDKPNV